ncbi:MAG: hypothetical protein ACT4QE_23150 [Anaerolineales bacterium]
MGSTPYARPMQDSDSPGMVRCSPNIPVTGMGGEGLGTVDIGADVSVDGAGVGVGDCVGVGVDGSGVSVNSGYHQPCTKCHCEAHPSRRSSLLDG